MASKVIDWMDPRQGMTREENLSEALSRLEHASEEEVRGWINDAGIDEDNFVPLDDNVANEVERLRGWQVQQLSDRWKNDWIPPSLPKELSEPLEKWRDHLNKRYVGDYCAAAGALIRSFLLDASSAEVEAWGRIEWPLESPTLHVFAEPGSVLAREQGFEQGGEVLIGPGQFGQQIALRCDEPGPWGELAWLSLAGSLEVMEADNVLPRLAIRQALDGTIEIRLAATTDEE